MDFRRTLFLVVIGFFLTFPHNVMGQGKLMLAGGGAEDLGNSWSKQPYSWFVENALNDTISVISFDDNSTFIPNYFTSFGAKQVFNIAISLEGNPSILEKISKSSGVFFKGGDQRDYLRLVGNQEIRERLIAIYENGGILGGTSAGAMFLGEFVTTGSARLLENVENPYNEYADYTSGILENALVIDTHFMERGRLLRLLGSYARITKENKEKVLVGIGIDDKTAVMIDENLQAIISGEGTVTFLRDDGIKSPFVEENQPVKIEELPFSQLVHGDEFDIASFELISTAEPAEFLPQSQALAYELLFVSESFTAQTVKAIIDQERGGSENFSSVIVSTEPGKFASASATENVSFLEFANFSDRVISLLIVAVSATELPQWRSEIGNADSLWKERGVRVEKIVLQSSLAPILGTVFVENLHRVADAGFRGNFVLSRGFGLSEFIVLGPTFGSDRYVENVTISVGLLASYGQRRFVLDSGFSRLEIDKSTVFNNESAAGGRPILVLDASGESYFGSSERPFSHSGRYNHRISSAKISVIPAGASGTWNSNSAQSARQEITPESDNTFSAHVINNSQTTTTTVKITTQKSSTAEVLLFDMLGRLLLQQKQQLSAGENYVNFSTQNLSSGSYIVQIRIENEVKSMVFAR